MKKILLLCTILLCFSSLLFLSSCGNSPAVTPDPGTESGQESQTEAAPPEGSFILDVSKYGNEFQIVRPDTGTKAFNAAVADIREKLISTFPGFEPRPISDWDTKTLPDEEKSALVEILIGETNRPESIKAHEELEEGEYLVRVDGKKLVIIGYTEPLSIAAANYFTDVVLKSGQRYLEPSFSYKASIRVEANYEKLAAKNSSASLPCLIVSALAPDEPFIADIIATEGYSADPTGLTDSTSAIQNALNACAGKGGTVFLPSGTYLVTNNITIPSGVTLRGEWEDPDANPSNPVYGTVIIARPQPLSDRDSKRSASPLITLSANAGAIGLTVYYPEQDAASVKPYGYTFYVGNVSTASMRNITLINPYRGIGVNADAEWHELMQLEHIRVCALETGIEMHYSSDVGYTVDVQISPRYWVKASPLYMCDDPEALKSEIRKNATGMILGDLDDETLSEIYIEGCKTGILFNTIKREGGFWGVIYDLYITDCDYGIDIETINSGNPPLLSRGKIEGSVYAVRNQLQRTPLKLCGIELKGAKTGYIIEETEDLSKKPITHGTFKAPAKVLYIADMSSVKGAYADIGPTLQSVLDEAGKTGGIVYLPSGIYHLKTPVTVPKGVLLQGSMPIFTRDANINRGDGGTLIFSYVGDGASFTLLDEAGFSGIRVWFPSTDPTTALEMLTADDPKTYSQTAVKGQGKGCFVTYSVFNGCFIGVDMRNCDNHFVKEVFGCAYRYFVAAGGKDGYVEECLANPNFTQRHKDLISRFDPSLSNTERWTKHNQGEDMSEPGFALLRDDLLRQYCVCYLIENGTNQNLHNCFMYAAKNLIMADHSTALLINDTADYLFGSHPMFYVKDSEVFAVNALRIFGISLVNVDSKLDICNRNDRNCVTERPYHSSVEFEDTGTLIDTSAFTGRIDISDCDTLDNVTGVTLTTKDAEVKEGEAAWKSTPGADVVFSFRISPPVDIDSYTSPYLHMWVYVEDITKLGIGQLEMTSSGKCDVEELDWTFMGLKEGWNELYYSINNSGSTGGEADLTALNYMRLYTTSRSTVVIVDDIYIIY